MNSSSFLAIAFVMTMLTGIASGLAHTMVLRRLARHHPEIWTALGSPSFIESNILSSEFKAFEEFFRERQYLTLSDTVLIRECRTSVVLKNVLVLEAIVLGLLIIYYTIQNVI